jgi:hypothetical protein
LGKLVALWQVLQENFDEFGIRTGNSGLAVEDPGENTRNEVMSRMYLVGR